MSKEKGKTSLDAGSRRPYIFLIRAEKRPLVKNA